VRLNEHFQHYLCNYWVYNHGLKPSKEFINDRSKHNKLPGCPMIWVARINKKDYDSSGIRKSKCGSGNFLNSEVEMRKGEKKKVGNTEVGSGNSEVGETGRQIMEVGSGNSEVGNIGRQLSDKRCSGFKPPCSKRHALPYALCSKAYALCDVVSQLADQFPSIRHPRSKIRNGKARSPKPATRNPQLATRNPQPTLKGFNE